MSTDHAALESLARTYCPPSPTLRVSDAGVREAFKQGYLTRAAEEHDAQAKGPVVVSIQTATSLIEAGQDVYGVPEDNTYRLITDREIALDWARRLGVSSISNWTTGDRIQVTS